MAMTQVHIDYSGHKLDFMTARRLALSQARSCDIEEPAVISWHQRSNHRFSPGFSGADVDSWWSKYGEGNGGTAKIAIGDDFYFVIMETNQFEKVRGLPLRSLRDASGAEFICLLPMMKGQDRPNTEACMPLDDWAADQY
jgi:hypothetical protein